MKKILLIALLLLVCVSIRAQSSPTAPALNLKDIHGRRLRSSDYKGKVVLVNFWATWCQPCRKEIPDLIKLQRAYRNKGLQVVGITYPPERVSRVMRFMRKLRMNYPVALGTGATKSLFTLSGTLPVTVVIGRDGNVRDVIEGIMYSDEFDQKIKPLLSGEPARSETELRVTEGRAARIQKAAIVVNGEGYEPSNIRLRRGVPAELTFIRKVEQTCGTEIVIPEYGVNRPLPLNVPVTVTFTPNRSGRFKFTCGMDMFRGALVVR
jgi:thiol-disulfide isomerase/thioredoxin